MLDMGSCSAPAKHSHTVRLNRKCSFYSWLVGQRSEKQEIKLPWSCVVDCSDTNNYRYTTSMSSLLVKRRISTCRLLLQAILTDRLTCYLQQVYLTE